MKINSKNILTILITFIMILSLGSAVMAQDDITIEQIIPAEIYPNDAAGQNYKAEITNSSGFAVDNLELVLNLPNGFSLTESQINEIKIVDGNGSLIKQIDSTNYNFNESNSSITFIEANIGGIPLADSNTLVVDYNLSTTADLNNSGKDLNVTFNYDDQADNSLTKTDTESLDDKILFGELDIDLTLSPQPQYRGGEVTVKAEITNSGQGKLFNSTFDPNWSTGFSSPTFLAGDNAAYDQSNWPDSGYQIPELAAGQTHILEYSHEVVDNQNFEILELVGSNAALNEDLVESANFRFNPRKPFISLDPQTDPATIDFDTSEVINIVVTNTTAGDGPARGIEINTNIPSEYDVINIANGWSYNAGVFTYDNADFPSVDNADYSETLSFNLQTNDPLSQDESGTITLQAEYTDDEDNPYTRPFETFDYNVTGIPTLTIESSASTTADHTDTDRMYLGENISYTYTVSLTEFDKFTDDKIAVELTNFDETRLSYLSHDAGGIGTFDSVNKIWTLDPSALDGQTQSITIDFEITDDQTKAKEKVITDAEVRGLLEPTDETQNDIDIRDNISNSFYLQSRYNEVELGQQTKEITNLPAEGSYDYTRTDNKHRVDYMISYNFGSESAGIWTGSTITDEMNKNQIYNETNGFIQYSTDQGSNWKDIPAASIISKSGELKFKLDFLETELGSDNVAGQTIYFKYRLEVTENGAIDSWTTLSLNGIDGSNNFHQAVRVPVTGANADLSIDVQKNGSTANDIDKGEKVDLKIDVSKNPWMIKDLKVRVEPDGFTYGDYSNIANTSDIEITGFNDYTPAISYDSTNDLITFDFSGAEEFIDQNSSNTDLKNLGTITLSNMIKDCSETFTASAEIDYRHGLIDSNTNPITKADQSEEPLIKRKSDLIITAVNPVIVTEETVTWTIDITNTDIGTAYSSEFIGTFSEVFDYQSSQIDSVTASPQLNTDNTQATWDLGRIESGATKSIQITADITDADLRTVKDFNNAFSSEVKWYTEEVNNIKYQCGSNTRNDFPQFVEPIKITDLVVKNKLVSPAEINICSEGFMEIVVQSTGQTRNYNLELRQDFLTTGITFDETKEITVTDQDGSKTYSISASDVEDTNGNLVFSEDIFAELAAIDIGEEIKIKFAIKTNGNFNASNEVQPAISWNSPSKYKQDNQEFSKNGSIYRIPRIRPEINLDLKGRNQTIGEQTFVDNPAAMAGKNTVLWKLDIENIGAGDAGNVWISSSDFPSNTVLYSDENLINSVDNNESDNYWVVSNLAAGESQSYYLEYTVPAASNETKNINTEVSWGCDDSNRLTTPGKSSDDSQLTTVPEITFSHENLNNNLTRKDGTIVLTMVNTGAPIYNLNFDYNLSDRYKLQSITSYSSNLENNEVVDNWQNYNTQPAADDSLNQINWSYGNQPIAAGRYQIEFELVDNVVGGAPRVSDDSIEINPTLDATYDYLNSNSKNESFDLNNLTPEFVELGIEVSPKKQIISDLANDVEWTISVTNNGNTGSVKTKVEQELGDGFDYTNLSYTLDSSYQGANFSYSLDSATGTLSWTDLEIPAGDTAEIVVTTKMLAGGSHTNKVQAEEISPYTGEIESITEIKEAYTAAFNLTKELITDPPSSGYFAPGEIVEYQVTADLVGNLNYKNLTIIDNLPSGLRLDDTITDYQNSTPSLVFNNTAEGQLEWTGTIDGSANQEAVINYKLRVVKDGVSRGNLITNTAEASFNIDYLNDSDDSNDIQFTADNSISNYEALIDSSSFNFQEPELTISRSADNETVDSSTVLEHTVLVSNGTADNISPAYETKIVETIPAGFRDKETNIANTVVIEKANGTVLTENTDYEIGYDTTNHQLIITFKDTVDGILNPAEEYIIKYQTEANDDIEAGLNYTFSAELEEYYSLAKNINDVEKYPADGLTITADKTFNVSSSTFTADSDITNVSPGDTVNYNLSFFVPAKTTVNSFDLSAELPEGLDFIVGSVAGPGTPENITGNDLGQWEPAQITGDPENGGQNVVFPDDDVTVTNDSSQDYEYRLSFQAKVLNIEAVSNGNSLNSDFSYSYNGKQLFDSVNLTVREPELELSKAFENVSGENSYQAGETVEYTITINHTASSTAAAYDLVVEDIIPAGMTYVSGSMTTTADVSLINTADSSGQELSWTIEELVQSYDSSTPLELTYQITIDDSVEPAEVLTNAAELSWTSHPDDTSANPDQRTGKADDSLNDYIQTTETDLTINNDLNITKSIIGGETDYAVGDTVSYRVTIKDLIKGTIKEGLKIADLIPEGLKANTFTLKDGNGNDLDIASLVKTDSLATNNEIIFNEIVNSAENGIAGDEIRIEFDAVVENIETNQAGVVRGIVSTLTYTDAQNNVNTKASEEANITIIEPDLELSKAFENVSGENSYQAGETVEYTITINHTASSTAAAYDLVVEDIIPAGMTYVSGSMTTTADVSLINTADSSGQELSWTIEELVQSYDSSTPLELTYQITIDDSVEPAEVLTNAAELSWTSDLDDNNDDRRTGTDADDVNDYLQTTETDLTINDGSSIVKNKVSTTSISESYVRIGDLVTYKLEIDIQKGSSTNFVVKDQLPEGMQYFDTVSINGNEDLQQNNLNGYQYQDISISYAETPGREIIWNLGDITNPADGVDRTFTITYQAQIIDAESLSQSSASINLSNLASISYDGVDNARDEIKDTESITLNQPELTLDISDNIANGEQVVPDDKVSYTITAENTGSAPAYDTVLEGLIPEGLRDAGISNISITINGNDRNDIIPVIDADGNLSWSLPSGTGADDYTIPVGGELVITYDLTVDQDLPYGNIGTASINADYYSFAENDVPADADLDDRRQYEADQVGTEIIDIKDASIDTNEFEYFKGTNEDVTKVVLTGNGRNLESIQDADGNLLGNDDYSIEIGADGKPIITLSKDYLDQQDLGELNLTFNMNYGTAPELTIKINQYQSDVDLKDPTEITAGQEQPVTFTFEDKDGSPISEKEVTLSEDGLGDDDNVEYSLDGVNWVDDINELNDGLRTDENGQVKVYVRSKNAGEKGTISAAVDSEIVTSGELEIVPAAVNKLGFVEQPLDNFVDQELDSVVVGVLDQYGNIITDYESGNITIKIKNNPADGNLSGTTTAAIENGIATFNGLSIDEVGRGYTFEAEAEGFESAISAEFNIKADIELDNYNITTNDSTPTISGTVDDLDSDRKVDVVIRDENGEIVFEGEAEVNEDGSWSIDVDQPLDLGEYEVEASITDDAGNTSTTTGVLEVYPTDIIINKTAAEKQVSIGDFISYKIEIINETDFDLNSFTLYDKLPAGFRFVKDSAVIVSETGSETKLKTEGNRLVSWEGLELNAESSMEIRYTLVVGSGVVNSNTYVNQAYAKVEENLISNTAEAEVLVIEDPLFTTSTVIGKVYLDQNEDGIQSEGEAEKGLGGIRIISTTGQIVETDQFGRFHFEIRAEANIQPLQTLVLKLDKNSLPAGTEVSSSNPVIIKIREGLMSEVNFRVIEK